MQPKRKHQSAAAIEVSERGGFLLSAITVAKKSASEAHVKTAILPLAHQPVSHRTEMWVS